MGGIGGEDLMKREKVPGGDDGAAEEKILVLVRLRPLSEKQIARNEVSDWECINKTTIIYRNSLQERSGLPTAYTYDRVFRGDCSTREVYEEGAKEIALSVVGGMNSTIFAYGQTSSGKTYTMSGITEYTVADIYGYIQKHEERAFVLKFSAMEIYNEAIRDLLSSDNTSLRVLDDSEKGTIVEKLTEETLRDWDHLKQLLSICEGLRRTGETSLNETSSRSHQILRLTIESSAREFLGKGKSTTLTASVNFVDLAGSERASQSLSAGARLKEGCHINRSLLTLSTVIRKLSKGKHGHINYRDSKLTRILQPSLGGNARTAIICTLSPAQSHVEQSRNTLLFASCAKEVTTKAQVNVVMSDKALVKHLQKELARLESELRSPAPTSYPHDYAALLKKKDLQIVKMEKEIREVTKQRDLAQSRVEDLLQVIKLRCTLKDREDTALESDDLCKEVRCIEVDGSREEVTPGRDESMNDALMNLQIALPNGDAPGTNLQNGFTRGMPGQNFQDLQRSTDSHYPDNPSPPQPSTDIFSIRSPKQTIRLSLKEELTNELSPPGLEKAGHIENTPPNGYEKIFPGRPISVRTKIPPLNYDDNVPRLSRNDSMSSVGSAMVDGDITSIQSFVAGLKEAHLQYEKQVADGQETGPNDESDVKHVGLDPLDDALVTSSEWPQEFERQQKLILELWESCNDRAPEHGPSPISASSLKALRRERDTLTKLLQKRFTEEERNILYRKFGIGLDTKRRRLQLVNLLWCNTNDMDHITESASIVARLVQFSEKGHALKEMFGLSFTPPRHRRRSLSWKSRRTALF